MFIPTKRNKHINTTLNAIARDLSFRLIAPSIIYVGRMLQRQLNEQGVRISLDEARRKVERYKHVQL